MSLKYKELKEMVGEFGLPIETQPNLREIPEPEAEEEVETLRDALFLVEMLIEVDFDNGQVALPLLAELAKQYFPNTDVTILVESHYDADEEYEETFTLAELGIILLNQTNGAVGFVIAENFDFHTLAEDDEL